MGQQHTPAWSSWVGIILVVLGVYLTAAHGNELLVHAVLDGQPSVQIDNYVYHCPEDELIAEGMSVALCQQASFQVDSLLLSRPDWFRGVYMILMSIGTAFAFASIFIGVGLIEYRSWAPGSSLVVLAGLLLVDTISFLIVASSGPLLRQMYLWQILIWFFIHALLLAAVVAGKDDDKTGQLEQKGAQSN